MKNESPKKQESTNNPKGGLIAFHPGALGDALIAATVLRAAAENKPNQPLTLVGRDYWRTPAESWPFVTRFVSLDSGPMSGLYRNPPLWPSTLPEPITAFAQAWVFAKEAANPLTQALNQIGLPTLTLPSRPLEPGLSLAQAQLRAAGLKNRSPFEPLAPLPAWLEEARQLQERTGQAGRPLLVIQPGSGGQAKNWPWENFLHLAAKAGQLGWRAVFLLGPHEDGLVIGPQNGPVWRGEPLTTVAGLFPKAAYLGNDSGISHLAGLYGAKGVAVFGPTCPRAWGPAGLVKALGPNVGELWPQPEKVWLQLRDALQS